MQQVISNLGYTGGAADVAATAALDLKQKPLATDHPMISPRVVREVRDLARALDECRSKPPR